MSEPIIKVHKLGKQYRIGAKIDRYGQDNFRDSILNTIKSPIRNFRRLMKLTNFEDKKSGLTKDTIWALKDVSFEINKGEVVGIIGRNGSGKSTLLKILSRITEPTEGYVEFRGRISSLLEVGTGFHRELTGRENIYLNGTILGMKKWEIDAKFDEIVAFSEIEKFIDTPVKHYSSGMYVRLAFAVAAHLNSDILLVDEVLAVGDVAFQKKCLGKMSDIAEGGRTVLFVSHNMHAVAKLCERIIWIDRGSIESIGPSSEIVGKYTIAMSSIPKNISLLEKKGDDSPVLIRNIRIVDNEGRERDYFNLFDPFSIELTITQKKLLRPVRLVIRIRSAVDESVILSSTDWDFGKPINCLESCEYTVRCLIPANLFNVGTYLISTGIDEPNGLVYTILENIKQFVVVNNSAFGDGVYGNKEGILSPYRKWELISSKTLEVI